MDLKMRIFRWENAIKDNPAVLGLVIVAVIAVAFLAAMYLDGYLKARKRNRGKRRGTITVPPKP